MYRKFFFSNAYRELLAEELKQSETTNISIDYLMLININGTVALNYEGAEPSLKELLNYRKEYAKVLFTEIDDDYRETIYQLIDNINENIRKLLLI